MSGESIDASEENGDGKMLLTTKFLVDMGHRVKTMLGTDVVVPPLCFITWMSYDVPHTRCLVHM